MFGFLGRLFGRGKNMVDERTAGHLQALLAGDAQRPSSEQAIIMQQGVKREMVHDDFVEGLAELDGLKIYSDQNKVNMIETNPDSLAIRVLASNLIALSILDPEVAEELASEARLMLIRTEANQSKQLFNMGGVNLNHAYAILINARLESAKKGSLVRILNTITEARTLQATVGTSKKGE
jgi:hypothetical protein